MLGCGAPTLFLPHLLTPLTFPYISPYLPHTPTHFATPPLIPLPTSPLPPPTPQHTFLRQLPHLPHLLKVWQSYHVTKFLWRSYWQPSVHYTFITPVYFLPKGLATGIFYAILRAFVLIFRLWKALCKDINIKE